MTPPCYTFPASELSERIQLDVKGRQRKMPLTNSSSKTRPHEVDLLRDCSLLPIMVQYSCVVAHPNKKDSPVRCWPVERFFRQCQDKKGTFTVETTAWEGSGASSSPSGGETVSTNTADEAAREKLSKKTDTRAFQ